MVRGELPRPCALLPHSRVFQSTEGEEANEDVGLDPLLALMPDRSNVQLIFLDAKSRFGLGELDVGLPQLLIAPIADVRNEEVYFPSWIRGPIVGQRGVASDVTARKPAGHASGSNVMAKRAAARWFRSRMRPICRFTVAGLSGFVERAMRADRRSSACSIRRLNLSCIARSLLRRSSERQRIAISSVLGMARRFDLDAFLHHAPAIRASQLGAELLQLRLRRADDVAPAGLAQPRQILGAGHAAVGDPDAPQHAVPRLHRGHDRLQGLELRVLPANTS